VDPCSVYKYKFCFCQRFYYASLSLDEHQTDDDEEEEEEREEREREKNDLDGRDVIPRRSDKTNSYYAHMNKEKRTVGPALATINTVSPLGTALTVPRSHPVTGI
jgi:hypothetical protein